MEKFGLTHSGPVLFFILLMSTLGTAQQKKTRAMTGSAAKGSAPADLKVAADLGQRLAKFQHVRMPFQTAGLTAREQRLVRQLVAACGHPERIFLRTKDPSGFE